MLVLSRRDREEIQIGSHITIVVVKTSRGKVKLGITAPKEVPVHRVEIAAKLSAEIGPKPLREPVHDRFF
jgi:carbon storage regulator